MFLQLDTNAVPPAYIKNIGQADNATRKFGWVLQDSLNTTTHTPLDITPNSGDRNCIGIESQLNNLLPIRYLTRLLFSDTAVLSSWSTANPSPIRH